MYKWRVQDKDDFRDYFQCFIIQGGCQERLSFGHIEHALGLCGPMKTIMLCNCLRHLSWIIPSDQ